MLDQINSKQTSEEECEKLINEITKDFIRPNGPTIYAFITDKVKDAVKVGYTDQHPEKRIAQWKEIYGKEAGEVECIGWWSSEEFNKAGERVFFWDHAIHKKISDRKFKQLDKDEFMATLTDEGKKIIDIHFSREFFSKYKMLWNGELDPEDKEELSAKLIEDIMLEMKKNIRNGTNDFKLYTFDKAGNQSRANEIWDAPDTYEDTKLQKETIENGVKAMSDEKKKNILMAAVMRFGKTHATYEIIHKAGLKRVIVCSAKADVRTSWRNDINHKDFCKDFVFIEVLSEYDWDITAWNGKDRLETTHKRVYKDTNLEEEYKGKTLIYFFTLHDLGGSVREIKNKHKDIFSKKFDLLVVDETHYGSHANTFGKATKLSRAIDDDNSDIEEEQKIAKEAESQIKTLDIKYDKVLQVSGTPYYILASNEMVDKNTTSIISKVSYSDMLKARDEWEKENPTKDPSDSPYFGIPTLHKIGLKLSKKCIEAIKGQGMTDSLTELFKTTKTGKLAHEDAVKDLMKALFGTGNKGTLAFLDNKRVVGNKVCKHTIMVLPRIASCDAVEKLLNSMLSKDKRQVFNIVGNDGHGRTFSNVDELNKKLEELDSKDINSVILTVNRFLTGVSMPLVDSMIYLKNASSPQEYDQNIFRLCTRHVKKVANPDNESRTKKVNMKENVYLIDFNIGNMLKMVANSARMKAAAEGNPTTERIKELMVQDLDATPLYCEDKIGNEVMSKMKVVSSKDLLEIYSGYNKNKSIADIVDDEIDLYDALLLHPDIQEIFKNLAIEGDKSSGKKIDAGEEDTEDLDNIGDVENEDDENIPSMKHLEDYTKEQLKQAKKDPGFTMSKDKFKRITKLILYCNLCLDKPYPDMETLYDNWSKDEQLKEMIDEFNIPIKEFYKGYKLFNVNFKQAYNEMLTRMVMLAEDLTMEGIEKFNKAIAGLGRLGKSEVVTPPEIVDKMIDKLDESEYKNAKSILLVNEKQAEFFYGLYKKFGKEVAKKCKIIPSSQIGKHLTTKLLKTLDMNDYINDIIVKLEDYDNSGKIDVKDFLNMDNKEIIDKNGGKRFDVCLMNPPYDSNLHLKFIDKTLEISENVINISPCDCFINMNVANKLSKKLANYIDDFEFISASEANNKFGIWISSNIAIEVFNHNAKGYKANFNEVQHIVEQIRKVKSIRSSLNFYKGQEKTYPYYVSVQGDYGYAKSWHYSLDDIFNGDCNVRMGFDTEEELNNFIESVKNCWPYKLMYIIDDNAAVIAHLPFMKDYTRKWTDEDFYEYFNLSDDDKKLIKDTIKNYYKPIDNKVSTKKLKESLNV